MLSKVFIKAFTKVSSGNSIFKLMGILAVTVAFHGCVTTHSGKESTAQNGEYSLSCDRQPDYDAGNVFGLLCTYENKTKTWQNFHVVKITGDDTKGFSVLSPEEVALYAGAVNFRNEKDKHNMSLALGGLFIVGAIASGSGDPGLSGAGAATAAASLGVMGTRGLIAEHDRAKMAGVSYGSAHLMGPETKVPGELFIRRSLLIESTGGLPQILTVCLDSPALQCHPVKISQPAPRRRSKSGA